MRFFILSIVFSCVLLSSCNNKNNEDSVSQDEPPQQQAKEVSIVRPVWVELQDTIISYGKIKSEQAINLSFQINGEVERIHCKRGGYVNKGEVLISLLNDQSENSLNKLDIEKDKIVEQLKGLDEQIAISRKELKDYESLLVDSLISKEQVDMASVGLMNYEVKQKQLELALKTIVEDVSSVDKSSRLYQIVAPASGKIIELPVQMGEHVTTGQLGVKIDKNNTPTIIAEVSDLEIVRINQGDKAEIVIDALPNDKISATVFQMPYESTGAKYNVELIFDRPLKRVLPGMYGQIKIASGRVIKGYTLPLNALINATEASGTILIESGGRAQELRVQVVDITNDALMIEGQIDASTNVLINVNGIVNPGDPVRILSGI